jgi:hypothetical protein
LIANLVAVRLHPYSSVIAIEKTGKKLDVTRLVFALYGCNLVKIQVIANILDSVVANR